MVLLPRLWRKTATVLEMIKFGHTVFALPFAFIGALLAARGLPEPATAGWILLAMVGARSCAMAFNRIVDREFDRRNPRTAERALPAGMVRLTEAWLLVGLSGLAFFVACHQLNPLTLKLYPLALGLTLFYSLTKRFTWLSHVVLGIAVALAPLGGFIAVRGAIAGYPVALSLAVVFWVAGFDVVYACLDAEFDRKAGLHSLPARFGGRTAFRIAGTFHALAFALFAVTGVSGQLNGFYAGGLALAGMALLYQHVIVKPTDLSRIRTSFFTMNGIVSIVLFTATLLSLTIG